MAAYDAVMDAFASGALEAAPAAASALVCLVPLCNALVMGPILLPRVGAFLRHLAALGVDEDVQLFVGRSSGLLAATAADSGATSFTSMVPFAGLFGMGPRQRTRPKRDYGEVYKQTFGKPREEEKPKPRAEFGPTRDPGRSAPQSK